MPSSPTSRGRGVGGKADPLLLSTSGAETSKAGDSTSSGANKVNPHLDAGVAVEAVEAEHRDKCGSGAGIAAVAGPGGARDLEDVVIASTGDSSTTSVVQQKPYPRWFQFVRRHMFKGWLTTTIILFVIFVLVDFLVKGNTREFYEDLKYASIPVVSILFTWWHVWLGLQMCFYPVHFKGCFEPYLGWQGIVPRRAEVMAQRSCDIMIGNLITIEEIVDRLKPDDFFESLHPVLQECHAKILQKIGEKYWPSIWRLVPESVKEEINKKALEESEALFEPIMVDLKKNIASIFDVKEMCIHQLTSRRELLVDLFQKIGAREFQFILHVSAVMGFCLGTIQLGLWMVLQDSDYSLYILPLSGLIIGYLTNWLGIFMIFKPTHPHIFCCGYLNFQGVFLKRQKQVATELSRMLASSLLQSKEMIEYVIHHNKMEGGYERLLNMHREHTYKAVDSVMGKMVKDALIPMTIGTDTYERIKEDVVQEMINTIPRYTGQFTEYADRVFSLEETLRTRLGNLPPDEFEGMLHPVFQEDEWMILLLGGVLGVLVGFFQGIALGA
ncbi:unnamed protein product [Amoebophrya sp. A25]|nr:unnamed protein product [Amoebophrya sp. A25]|eukprot:GSA25T00003396001.1